MEILKKITVLLSGLIFTVSLLHGQQFETQIAAFKESYQLENKGDYHAAANSLKAVYQASSYEINLRLGWLSYKSGSLTESESYYRKAISIMPYGIEARFGLVYPLSSMGNWTQVIEVYEKILEIDPDNSLANYRYGLLLYNRKDYLKADRLISLVVNLFPFDYDSVVLLGWIKLKLGNTVEAKLLFQKALLNHPDDPSALKGLLLIQ